MMPALTEQPAAASELSIEFKERVLQAAKVGLSRVISRTVLDSLSIDAVPLAADAIVFKVEAWMLGDIAVSHVETVQHFEPANAWQMMRRDLYERLGSSRLGRWLAATYPVRYVTHTYSVTWKEQAVYPECDVAFERQLGRPAFLRSVRHHRVAE